MGLGRGPGCMPGRFRSTRARGPGKGSQSTNESAVSAEKDGDGDGEPQEEETSMPTQRQAFQACQACAKGNGDLVGWSMAVTRSCGANTWRARFRFSLWRANAELGMGSSRDWPWKRGCSLSRYRPSPDRFFSLFYGMLAIPYSAWSGRARCHHRPSLPPSLRPCCHAKSPHMSSVVAH